MTPVISSTVGSLSHWDIVIKWRSARFVLTVVVIVNSRFLQRPQKRSRSKQLINRCLTKTKSIGGGQDPESQAGRQSVVDGVRS